jgi:hypothetical protein
MGKTRGALREELVEKLDDSRGVGRQEMIYFWLSLSEQRNCLHAYNSIPE